MSSTDTPFLIYYMSVIFYFGSSLIRQSEEESSTAYQELDSDESWSPAESTYSSIASKKRKPYERKSGVRRTRQPVIDKKERKKIQNVEAARRYR